MNYLGALPLVTMLVGAAARDWQVVRLDNATAAATGAYCLAGPGSNPAYYISPGTNKTAFKIHFRGGGWCFSEEDCLRRSTMYLGDSRLWPDIPTSDEGTDGFWGDDPAVSGQFAEWTTIWMIYCDGTSWTSDRTEPLQVESETIYFRGRRILDAILADAEQRLGLLTKSDAVIVGGTSAGGLATYLHASYLRQRIRPEASLRFMPDAGFFLDAPDTQGEHAYRANFQGAYGPQLWNGTGGTDQGCIASYPSQEAWHCFMAQYAFPFASTTGGPFYVLNSMADSYQLGNILKVGCSPDGNAPGSCSDKQVQQIQDYRLEMAQVLSTVVVGGGAGHSGLFATACYQHEESCRDGDFDSVRVGGSTDRDNFEAWWVHSTSVGAGGDFVRLDGPWGSNPTCDYNITHHGSC